MIYNLKKIYLNLLHLSNSRLDIFDLNLKEINLFILSALITFELL